MATGVERTSTLTLQERQEAGKMRHRIGVLLIAAAFAGLAPAPAVLAQDASQTQSFDNRIEAGGRRTGRRDLRAPDPARSCSPARRRASAWPTRRASPSIFRVPPTPGRNVQAIDQGDLRSANIVRPATAPGWCSTSPA